ncbi:MAG: NosD domain-containing protein, partial [Candidatus Hodarchaeota archaeon]
MEEITMNLNNSLVFVCMLTLLGLLCLTSVMGVVPYSSSHSLSLYTSPALTKDSVVSLPEIPSITELSFPSVTHLRPHSPLTSVQKSLPPSSDAGSLFLDYTPHDPISISSDAELAAIANDGDGTEIAPYIVEGWNISAVTSPGLSIRGTTTYFIIQNNLIWGNWMEDGIYIQNVAAGTAIISNNVLINNSAGIVISGSINSVVMNNTCIQNGDSITFRSSPFSTVINNTCQNLGEGIAIHTSDSATVINNTCQNNHNGIRSQYSHNVSIIGNLLLENEGLGLILLESAFSTIINNLFLKNNMGIYQVDSDFALISNNTCTESTETGFLLEYSTNCMIIANFLISNQRYGIELVLGSDYNQIYHNRFLSNNNGSTQAYDEGVNNDWYDVTKREGNHWDDYRGMGTYPLAGPVGAIDPYPLNEKLEPSDSDDDGLPDWWDVQMGFNPLVDDAQEDFDNDTLSNLEEYLQGTDPHNSDCDMDGLTDGDEVNIYTTNPLNPDSDMDGLPDRWEVTLGTHPLTNDTKLDPDHDGLVNFEEYNMGTDPLNPDSDEDGLSDGEEVKKYNTDPLNSDSDNDLFPDGLDYGWWGNPRNRWDNPLIRSILLMLMIGLVGLG